MKMEIPLVLATTNQGKIKEMKQLLEGFPVKLKSLDQFGPLAAVSKRTG